MNNIAKNAVIFKTSRTDFDRNTGLSTHIHIAVKPYHGGNVPNGGVWKMTIQAPIVIASKITNLTIRFKCVPPSR